MGILTTSPLVWDTLILHPGIVELSVSLLHMENLWSSSELILLLKYHKKNRRKLDIRPLIFLHSHRVLTTSLFMELYENQWSSVYGR